MIRTKPLSFYDRGFFLCFPKGMKDSCFAAMFSRWILSLALLLLLGACATLVEKPERVPFHSLYEPIEDTKAQNFLDDGIAYLKAHYAPLRYPVREVKLLLSKKNREGRRYRIAERFSKTETIDASQGRFAIYIAVPPSDPEFYPLLAHEIGHLKAPGLVDDWEMEGFCMVFSEKLCQHLGYDWSVWQERFYDDPKGPYARAYLQAKSKENTNGPPGRMP